MEISSLSWEHDNKRYLRNKKRKEIFYEKLINKNLGLLVAVILMLISNITINAIDSSIDLWVCHANS